MQVNTPFNISNAALTSSEAPPNVAERSRRWVVRGWPTSTPDGTQQLSRSPQAGHRHTPRQCLGL
ncbi:MAG: hypothetical protein MI867_14190, partial [Pseudomonadales bacterium]|nr:hypothetical protein [Pseudomonadales bacterium]